MDFSKFIFKLERKNCSDFIYTVFSLAKEGMFSQKQIFNGYKVLFKSELIKVMIYLMDKFIFCYLNSDDSSDLN
ncbi:MULTISPECIES: hypothetical protein [Chryseobacterium]|uniref:Uncharacterized protein n=1 Tax=Chryseobacterium wanjuense TaxID=356305 RepID=A0A1I0RZ46_9FLAO|nr:MULTISPECIES: hypothetical protein [Chryseobacterium]KYH03717.1 hypothetical protein A1704_20200 [Chryseobacterium cucumeris]SEW47005.1 hypothetical protein SAMN05421841_3407 [Chryseobacterium wanjuense]